MTTRGKWVAACMQKNKVRTYTKLKTNPDANHVSRRFQINVKILEGRKLKFISANQATSYVVVSLDEVKHQSGLKHNTRVPYYGENFTFELFTSLQELNRKCLWFAVMEPCGNAPRTLGKAGVDLGHVWRQPHHRVTQNWVMLSRPTDETTAPVGYLRVNISISTRVEILNEPDFAESIENLESNLLLPSGSEQQPACYQMTIYRAYNVPCSASSRPDLQGNPPSTFLRITFSDLVGETSPQPRTSNPVFIERVSLVEMFPNVCNTIQLEVCSVNAKAVLASARLKLSEISHDGENESYINRRMEDKLGILVHFESTSSGFLPTFGPSLLHMYGPWRGESSEDGPFYRGAVLLAMKTIVPDYRHSLRTVHVESVSARLLDTEWIVENFVVFCPVFEVSMLDKSMSGTSCGVAVTVGEIPFGNPFDQDSDDFGKLMCEIKQKKLHYSGGRPMSWGHLELETCPVLQLAVRLPDFRFRMFMNNVLLGIVTDLENNLTDISARLAKGDEHPNDLLKSLHRTKEATASKIQRFLEIVRRSSLDEDMQKYTTELDHKLVQLQKEKIEKICCRIKYTREAQARPSYCSDFFINYQCSMKKSVKRMLAESKYMLQELKNLVYKSPNGWPRLSLWILSNGSRVAYAKMMPSDVLHSVTPEQCGQRCGKIQTFYLKPIKCSKHDCVAGTTCHCIAGKVELLAWMGAFRNRGDFVRCIPEGFSSAETGLGIECDPMSLECCVNVYRAKLPAACDVATGLSPFVRIYFINNVKDTQVCHNTSFPVWNEVLRISCCANVTPQRLERSPPEMLVEVLHCDATHKGKVELVGRVSLAPVYLRAKDSKPPLLDWMDIHLGEDHVGKIQMSAQLTEVIESGSKTSLNKTEEFLQATRENVVRQVLTSCVPEPLPQNVLPVTMTYKIDVYFWGLREVSIRNKPLVTLELEDTTIKSAIITECKPNCNFPHPRISQTFEGNLTNGSQLMITLYDTTTFGRMLVVGSNVKKPQKYQVTWIPKREWDDMLAFKPVVNNNFMQVNRKTFVKRTLASPRFETSKTYKNQENLQSQKKKKDIIINWKKVKQIFGVKKDSEEEMMLLPMYSTEKEKVVLTEMEDDWWTRYYNSLIEKTSGDRELAGNRITIYDSELECQPDFSRFKDWCGTIKIYSGSKTGIPDKDENLRCGFLKANIAIYNWPPPADTVAVSSTGANLDGGYFDGYPNNDPARYLVRVYAVKCSNLVTKGFTTSSRCYVAVKCNGKVRSDPESSVPRDAEPVFGKMYELDCTLPDDYLLKISVVECGPTDELIGCTSIDLEDRAYTKYRATVGLAAEYNMTGCNRWRDSKRPSAILEQLCGRNHLPAPEYPDPSTVVFNGVEYKDLDSGTNYTSPLASKENLCLSILHKWHTIPVVGHRLVPEHVEVRTLYDPDKPGVAQGKIHMWVDMFPLDCRRMFPSPVSIRPRPDENYELRVIVWGVRGLKAAKGANIYVRAWIGPSDETQDTDIYTTTHGAGCFNWRMIFQFQYKHTEKKLVFQDKAPCMELTELFPPILVVQVLDFDAPDAHQCLGILTLDLSCMPRGARLSHSSHAVVLAGMRRVSMFAVRNARGWWPLKMVDRNAGTNCYAGMIELEISLLSQEKALLMPVGTGRDPPAPLPDPTPSPEVTRVNSECSLLECNQTTWLLVVFGLLLLACCMYWELPLVVFSVIPSTNI